VGSHITFDRVYLDAPDRECAVERVPQLVNRRIPNSCRCTMLMIINSFNRRNISRGDSAPWYRPNGTRHLIYGSGCLHWRSTVGSGV
jgi:hypothetical protein